MSVLEISRVGACAVLTLNRPAARNALDMDLRNALAKALPEIRDDATVRAVVLTGAGGHFAPAAISARLRPGRAMPTSSKAATAS